MKRAFSELESTVDNDHVTSKSEKPIKPTPKISRKVSACTECQSRKIKCDLVQGKDICTRCERKSLRCVVNKSLQSLLEEESQWKIQMESESQKLQIAVSEILRTLNLPSLDAYARGSFVKGSISIPSGQSPHEKIAATPGSASDRVLPGVRFLSELPSPSMTRGDARPNHAAGMAMTRENSQEAETNAEGNTSLVSAPMGTLFEVTKLRNLRSNPRSQQSTNNLTTAIEDDFISAGLISLSDAERLFNQFNVSLNHYLWGGIALVHGDLMSVRRSSTLLTAAIMTVTALHIPGMEHVFDVCYAEFVSLVCATMLDRYHNLDGIRALAMGAFWLSDLSWKLSGHAVRIATELNLHQSYSKVMKGDRSHFESARLWYILYVCDHHFSIAYGRPPVISEDFSIVHHEKFLQLPCIDQRDLRVHSQVSMFSILTDMYHHFGADDVQLDDNALIHVRQFNRRLDAWRQHWEQQLAPNPHIGSYPYDRGSNTHFIPMLREDKLNHVCFMIAQAIVRTSGRTFASRGVVLHYHYAKLQLNALSLRGNKPTKFHELPADRKEFAMIALSSAEALLHIVLEQVDIRNSIVGVPLYLHTMITFASTWLLKMHQLWGCASLPSDSSSVQRLVLEIINILQSARASQRHLAFHIAEGLRRMLDRFIAWEKRSIPPQAAAQVGVANVPQPYVPLGISYDMNYGMYSTSPGNPMQLWDPDYFPVGFFDVLSSAMP